MTRVVVSTPTWVIGPILSGLFLARLLLPDGILTQLTIGPVDIMGSALIWASLLWMFSIAYESNRKSPPALRRSIIPVSVGCLYGAAALPFLFYLAVRSDESAVAKTFLLAAFPSHLYVLYFTAKQFVTFTKGRRATFVQYIGPIFGLFYSVIGVWFIQPQVRKYLGSKR